MNVLFISKLRNVSKESLKATLFFKYGHRHYSNSDKLFIIIVKAYSWQSVRVLVDKIDIHYRTSGVSSGEVKMSNIMGSASVKAR